MAVKMGIIGAGFMGNYYAKALSQYDGSELVAICDIDRERARRLAAEYGLNFWFADYEDMLKRVDLEAVVVATPDFLHKEPVIAALEAGKEVLCEKPLAVTLEDCWDIVDMVQKSGKKLMVNFGNRHRPQVRRIKTLLESQELGKIQYIYIALNEKLSKTLTLSWVDKTSPVWFLLSHCVDTVRWLAEAEAVEVYGLGNRGVLSKRGISTLDSVVCLAKLDNGASVCFESSWVLPDSYVGQIDFRVKILGEKGLLESDLFPHDLAKFAAQPECLDYSFEVPDYAGKSSGWWFESVHYFVDCVAKGLQPKPGAQDGLAVTEVLLAIEESVKSGRPVRVKSEKLAVKG